MKKKIKIRKLLLINFILILITIKLSSSECDNRENPILLQSNGACSLLYCTKEQYNNNTCIIDNKIIKTQWLNNIIVFGEKNCRFTKIAKYLNTSMIVFSAINPGDSLSPFFFGLKNNGRPLFIKNDKETPFFFLNISIGNSSYISAIEYEEGEIFITKMLNNDEEYIIYFGKDTLFTELYDFENDNIIFRETKNLFSNRYLVNIRGSIFNLKESNNILYAGIFDSSTTPLISNKYLFLYSLSLDQKESLTSSTSIIKKSSDRLQASGNMVSCFQGDSKHIICFYIASLSERKYKIINYDDNLTKKSFEYTISTNYIITENIFLKCIHHEADIGIFIYYKKIDNEGPYPIISFIERKVDRFEPLAHLDEIQLNNYIFNTSLYLNDFIKLSDNIICLGSVSKAKDILYITLINIFDDNEKYKIRYYVIRAYDLYHYKICFDIRLDIFKESLALASSFCNNTNCEISDTHYSSLIVFSYPNSTDVSKDIVDVLFDKNIDIKNLVYSLNFSNYITIENNIFGLIYYKIIIYNIENCNNIKLISSKNNENITIEYELLENDDINATFFNYDLFDCKIEYAYYAIDPDLSIFDDYPENINTEHGDDNEIYYNNIKAYSGRLSYYNLYLKDKLTNDCSDNCDLCYDNSDKNCIVCNINSNENIEIDSNGKKIKNCLLIETTQIETETPTEAPTEATQPESTQIETHHEATQSEAPSEKATEKQTETPTEKPTEKITNKETDKILSANDCIKEENIGLEECSHVTVKNDEYQDLEQQVKNNILNTTTYKGEKKVYTMENVIIQVSKYDDQEDSDNSNIDLGKCEEILRREYTIPEEESLIIFKSDLKSSDSYTTYVQYEIYHPDTLEPLNLNLCSEEQISISVSVNLNNNTKSLINSLGKSGHDLYNKDDSFYNDLCVTYTTENGTDMTMNDRQNIIENSGESLNVCQVGCNLKSFNYTTQKAKCDCDVKNTKTITDLNDIEFNSKIMKNILGELKYSNYLVVKCYKLLLDTKLLQKNIGFIVMTIIFIALFILFFIYIIKGKKKIEYYIKAIINNKSVYINNRKTSRQKKNSLINNKNKTKEKLDKNPNKNKKIGTNKFKDKNIINKFQNDKKKKAGKKNNAPPIKKKINKKKLQLNKNDGSTSSLKNLSKSNDDLKKKNEFNNLNINIFPINNLNYEKSKKGKETMRIRSNKKGLKKEIKKNAMKEIKKGIIKKIKKDLKKDVNIYKFKNKNKMHEKGGKLNTIEKQNRMLKLDYINYQTLNIHELNTLDYNIAILVDKRTFFQYYCSLIRKKQIIIFTFVPIDDYNLVSLKISLFLLTFSLYMTVNAFFFTDHTMHQIYENNGMNFLEHIRIIIYSSLISSVVTTLLKQLSLSENNILSIKKAKYMKVTLKRAKDVQSYLKVKFIIYFIVSFILNLLFWYFISCFCAVYTNTQLILIKDSLISFGISMLYPFGINLLPAIFRIPALRATKKDKICVYKFSQLLALI